MKRVALYIRVSTDHQAKNGDSLREQEYTLKEYVAEHKDMIIHSTYIDDGISGQKLQRDEFQRLLNDISNDKIDIVLFTKLDRWFRNLRHYLNTQELLDKHNVSWNAVSQQYYDTTTAYGRTFIAQVMSFAELEAQMTSERIKSVFANKVILGEAINGKTPLGYSIENKKLVVNDDAAIVKDIFEHYSIHNNFRKTVIYLYEKYNISRDYQTIKKMLKNEIYTGKYRSNEHYCEAIISREKFEKIQSMMKTNLKNNAKRVYIFSGLMVCHCCGRKLGGQVTYYNYTKKNGTKVSKNKKYYRCTSYKNNPETCRFANQIYEENIEQYLISNIKKESKRFITDYNDSKQTTHDIERHNKNIDNKLSRLKKAYLDGVIELDEYRKDKINLVEQYKETEEVETRDFDYFNKMLSTDFKERYVKLKEEAKRIFWKSIIKEIVVNEDKSFSIIFL